MTAEGGKFLYFSYGSNMLTARLKDRCPSARRVALALAKGYDLVFTKRSIDRSAKATLAPADGSHCPGIIFEIAITERDALDAFEGADYTRDDAFAVISADGKTCTTTTYLAQESTDGLRPYDWYLALIIAGGYEHGLDAAYVDRLRRIACVSDPVTSRKSYLDALQALEKSGIDDFGTLLAAAAEPVVQ
jgi:hypothetical protein